MKAWMGWIKSIHNAIYIHKRSELWQASSSCSTPPPPLLLSFCCCSLPFIQKEERSELGEITHELSKRPFISTFETFNVKTRSKIFLTFSDVSWPFAGDCLVFGMSINDFLASGARDFIVYLRGLDEGVIGDLFMGFEMKCIRNST